MTISFVQTDSYILQVVVTCEVHAIQHNCVRLALVQCACACTSMQIFSE